jgi:hypothetical protein
MMMPLLPLLLQILFLGLVTSDGRYLVILGERRSPKGVPAVPLHSRTFERGPDNLPRELGKIERRTCRGPKN